MEQMQRIQHELVLDLNSCADLRQGVERVLKAVLQLECLDCGGVYLANPDHSLDLVAHRGLSDDFIAAVSRFPSDSPSARLVLDGKPRFGTYDNIIMKQDGIRRKEGLRAFAVIPIMSRGQLIAVFNLSSHSYDSVPADTRDVLETIALQIGGTLLRLRADAALRESEEIFNRFMDNSPIYVFFKDENIKTIRLSRNYEKMLGKPMAELLGKTMDELFPSEIAKKMVADDLRILKEGKLTTIDEELNGRFFTTIKFPIHIEGRPRYLAGYTFDVTEQRKMQETLQRADKLEALGVLAGGIAHDFNNLLSGLFGYVEMAREAGAENPAVTTRLDKALAVFDRARDLTRQLLTFSRGGAPVRKAGHLGPLIRECVGFALSGSTVACEFNIAPDLLPCDFDEGQLNQVVDNIIINALQAMPMGGRITVSAQNVLLKEGENPVLKPGRYVKVSIADTGTGIQPKLLSRIFDPFFTTKQKGNGLGLATCFSIMQKHEGAIEAESELDKGSVFHLFLPASEKAVGPAEAPTQSSHQGKGIALIMDDEDFIREFASETLTAMGYSVLTVLSGGEALKACMDNASLSFAILDLTIPGGAGGKETIKEIRKILPDLPVFASSGYSDDPVMAHPRDYGFTDSIRKPYRGAELAELLNRHRSSL